MAEKPCANPRCTCMAEPGKEFCSSNCREATTSWLPVPVPIRGAEGSVNRSSPHRVHKVIIDEEVGVLRVVVKCMNVVGFPSHDLPGGVPRKFMDLWPSQS